MSITTREQRHISWTTTRGTLPISPALAEHSTLHGSSICAIAFRVHDARAAYERVPVGHGFTYLDHRTHNVYRGRMAEWADFYERLFNFREARHFDIEGQVTCVKSKAKTSPCGKIRIPINEEGNETSGQIQEYLDKYHGEGIQHIALGTGNLMATVDALRTPRCDSPRHDRRLLRAGRHAHSWAR